MERQNRMAAVISGITNQIFNLLFNFKNASLSCRAKKKIYIYIYIDPCIGHCIQCPVYSNCVRACTVRSSFMAVNDGFVLGFVLGFFEEGRISEGETWVLYRTSSVFFPTKFAALKGKARIETIKGFMNFAYFSISGQENRLNHRYTNTQSGLQIR